MKKICGIIGIILAIAAFGANFAQAENLSGQTLRIAQSLEGRVDQTQYKLFEADVMLATWLLGETAPQLVSGHTYRITGEKFDDSGASLFRAFSGDFTADDTGFVTVTLLYGLSQSYRMSQPLYIFGVPGAFAGDSVALELRDESGTCIGWGTGIVDDNGTVTIRDMSLALDRTPAVAIIYLNGNHAGTTKVDSKTFAIAIISNYEATITFDAVLDKGRNSDIEEIFAHNDLLFAGISDETTNGARWNFYQVRMKAYESVAFATSGNTIVYVRPMNSGWSFYSRDQEFVYTPQVDGEYQIAVATAWGYGRYDLKLTR